MSRLNKENADHKKRGLRSDINELVERATKALNAFDKEDYKEAVTQIEEITTLSEFSASEIQIFSEDISQEGGKGVGEPETPPPPPPAPTEPEPAPAGATE